MSACIATAPEGIHRQTDDGAGGSGIDIDAGPPDDMPDASETKDPHAVTGADPSHGPFSGGDNIIIRGKGFSSNVRIWIGPNEVPKASVFAIDPTRVRVSVPAGTAGPADVTAQNGDDKSTKRTLVGGYVYDALFAAPSSGPVPGGTVIEIIGQNTKWDATTTAKIDNKPCEALEFVTPTLLNCTVPQGTPGSKTVSVSTAKESIIVLDAYTYEDTNNGYKGGLSGAPLNGQIKALVYDNYTGDPIPSAHLIVGADIATALVKQTDSYGVAVIKDPSLNGPKTVTITGYCHSPITFVSEPVDTVTVYLDPTLTPICAGSGDPPPVGGKVSSTGTINGDLVWPSDNEFKKGGWKNIPAPIGPNEKKTAYVFVVGGDPTQPFQLPDVSTAVHEDSPGQVGYGFNTFALPGDRALYALAGIEDDSVNPRRFTAYVIGVARGVPVLPNGSTDSVIIPMTKTLDHALTLDPHPPAPGPKGPDHLHATVAIMLGNDGFALLPIGQKDPLIPLQQMLSFVGVPNLDGDFSGSSFYATTKAATGPTNDAPLSAVQRILTNDTSKVLTVDGFVGLPMLSTPPANGAWDLTHLASSFTQGGAPIDLTVYDIVSGNGRAHWTIANPSASGQITVPDISGFQNESLVPGPLTIAVYGAHYTVFDYKKLIYRQLRPQGMTAYSLDYFNAHF